MTLRDVLGVIRRRWYVFAIAVVSACLLAVLFARDGGTYSTRTVVSFTLPAASTLTPDNGTNNESIIAFAGTVAAQVNQGRPTPQYSRGDAPYYGAGVRQGALVGLQQEGTQWGASHGSAIIEVQVVGRTERWVADEQARILAEIQTVVATEQSVVADADQRIRVHVEPLTMRIEHVTATRSSQILAYLAMAAAGALIGWGVALVLDRSKIRRRGHARGREHARTHAWTPAPGEIKGETA